MSQQVQYKFIQFVNQYYQKYKHLLALNNPNFSNSGFVCKATMFGLGGSVEILCGPAEYHAEIFINTLKDSKRWNLAGLMNVESIRDWLIDYSKCANNSGKSILESDVEWIFLILIDGLKGVSNFEWLQK